MRKIKCSDLLVSLCFLAFLFGTMAATVLSEKEEESFFENRNLTPFPAYTAEADGDGSYTQALEKYVTDHVALRDPMLLARTRLDLALGRPMVNDIVLSDGWFLPYLGYRRVDEEEIAADAAAMADNLARIRDAAAEYGGHYCLVAVPNQYVYGVEAYPDYMDKEFAGERLGTELLKAELTARGVDYLDVGAAVEELGHPEGYMSKVDHHYTMEGAFLTYQLIMEKLQAITGEELSILGEEDVILEILPDLYLGSRARKLLGAASSDEKVQVLRPREEVPFQRWDNGAESPPEVYVMPQEDEYLTYAVYMGGDMAQTTIATHREELPSILIYGDSFTNALECVFYLSFDRMDALDLRYSSGIDLPAYIRETQPDYVVYVRDYGALLDFSGNGGGENLS